MKWVKEQPVADEVKNIKCAWEDIEDLFDDYVSYFGKSWEEIKTTHQCEDVARFCMKKDRERYTYDFDIITPEEGIRGGHFIICGHYIEPPYKISFDSQTQSIKINNLLLSYIPKPHTILKSNYGEQTDRLHMSTLAYKYLLYENEKKVEKTITQMVNYKIIEWQDNNKKNLFSLLKDFLDHLKRMGFVLDYQILDKEKLSFALKFYYLTDWSHKPSEQKIHTLQDANSGCELYSKKDLERFDNTIFQDKGRVSNLIKEYSYRKFLDEAENSSILKFYGNESESEITMDYYDWIKQFLIINLADGTDYQKLIALKNLSQRRESINQKEIVFNYRKSSYISLIKSGIKQGLLTIK